MKNMQFTQPINASALAGKRDPAVSLSRRLGRLLVFVVPLLVPTGALARYGNSSVANPIGPAHVPPSSYQSGAVPTPGATSDTGNLLVTGNVSGAKQFRAPVPYKSATRFQGTLGSTSLDSFLRASAVPESDGYSRPYGPFYSPTGTVAKIGAGQVADSAPLMQASAMNAAPVAQPQAAPATPVKDWRMWDQLGNQPASNPSLRTWKPLSSDPAPALADRRVSQRQSETAIPESAIRQLGSTQETRPASQPTPTTTQTKSAPQGELITGTPPRGYPFAEGLQSQTDEGPGWKPLRPSEPSRSNDGVAAPRPQALAVGQRDSGVFPRGLRTQPATAIGDQSGPAGITRPNGIGNVLVPEAPKPGATSEAKTSGAVSSFQRLEKTARELDAPSALLQSSSNERVGWSLPAPPAPGSGARGTLDSYRSANGITWAGRASDRPEASRTETSSADRVSALLKRDDGKPTIPDSSVAPSTGVDPLFEIRNRPSAPSDFERHMHDARVHVQQGRYYRAAESFTRASAYEPSNAIPLLGRSIALFAAGEYVTSSLCLARALELDPQSAVMQARIVNAAGGPARFELRLADLEQCLKNSNAPQLQFLLAYVYHHVGRAQEAARAVEAARRGLPASVSVDILKAAVAP